METITMIVETLSLEHEYLSAMIMGPITDFVAELLLPAPGCPAAAPRSGIPGVGGHASLYDPLHFGELERLQPEQVRWCVTVVGRTCRGGGGAQGPGGFAWFDISG